MMVGLADRVEIPLFSSGIGSFAFYKKINRLGVGRENIGAMSLIGPENSVERAFGSGLNPAHQPINGNAILGSPRAGHAATQLAGPENFVHARLIRHVVHP